MVTMKWWYCGEELQMIPTNRLYPTESPYNRHKSYRLNQQSRE